MAITGGTGTGGGGTDLNVNIRSTLDSTGFDQTVRKSKETGKALDQLTRSSNMARKASQRLGNEFKFEYLGTLFFGMALRRTFEGIEKSGTDTFRRITEATDGTVTNLTTLAASSEFLKFEIGDAINTALDPYMETILGINDGIADFIDQNPELVGGFLLVGKTVGGALEGLSQLALGFMSIKLVFFGSPATGPGLLSALTEGTTLLKGISLIQIGAGAAIIVGLLLLYELTKDVRTEAEKANAEFNKMGVQAKPGGTPGASKETIMAQRFMQGDPMLTTPISSEEFAKQWKIQKIRMGVDPVTDPFGGRSFRGGGISEGLTPAGNYTVTIVGLEGLYSTKTEQVGNNTNTTVYLPNATQTGGI